MQAIRVGPLFQNSVFLRAFGGRAVNLPQDRKTCGRLDSGQTYGPTSIGFPLTMALTFPAAPDLPHLQQRHKSLRVTLQHKFLYLSYLTSGGVGVDQTHGAVAA